MLTTTSPRCIFLKTLRRCGVCGKNVRPMCTKCDLALHIECCLQVSHSLNVVLYSIKMSFYDIILVELLFHIFFGFLSGNKIILANFLLEYVDPKKLIHISVICLLRFCDNFSYEYL